jgi:hypothetical protein
LCFARYDDYPDTVTELKDLLIAYYTDGIYTEPLYTDEVDSDAYMLW